MDEQDLKALIRASVAKHLGAQGSGLEARAGQLQTSNVELRISGPGTPAPWTSSTTAPAPGTGHPALGTHVSHHVYLSVVNQGDACVIEPNVPCDHCGYCKSHGH